MESELIHKIFDVLPGDFEALALAVFRFQYANNFLYAAFVDALRIDPDEVGSMYAIPFLPIAFFKSHKVTTTAFEAEVVFESSGTTQDVPSRHYVKSIDLYRRSFHSAFNLFYGSPEQWCILGLLPSYLERERSSLVLMADELIKASGSAESGFYLYDHARLFATLADLERWGKPCLLLGVTFALLDFAEKYRMRLDHTVVMETGGMKGRKQEMTREEVHGILKERLGVNCIHSEYGMTELLSQAYSTCDGRFSCPPWMAVMVRDEDDPLFVKSQPRDLSPEGTTGIVNVIDLSNIYSCSFIATDDVGRVYPDGRFEVLGRMDNSDRRGCSLMVVEV